MYLQYERIWKEKEKLVRLLVKRFNIIEIKIFRISKMYFFQWSIDHECINKARICLFELGNTGVMFRVRELAR